MFGYVANYLIGLLKSVYGISASVVSSVINTVVNGTLIVRQPGGTAGTNEIQIKNDGTNGRVTGFQTLALTLDTNATGPVVIGTAGNAQVLILAGGNDVTNSANRVITIGGAIPIAVALKNACWISNAAGTGAGDVSLYRAAAGVYAIGTGLASGAGWLQNTGGEARRTATQTVTDSASFVADDTQVFTLIAGRKYRFYHWSIYTVVNTSGVKLDLNGGTATMTAINGIIQLVHPTTGAIGNRAQITALTSSAALTATGTLYTAEAWGTLQCNAAGTFAPRFAQNAETGAAESVIAQIGSFTTLSDMP